MRAYCLNLAAEMLCDGFGYRGLLGHAEDPATHADSGLVAMRL